MNGTEYGAITGLGTGYWVLGTSTQHGARMSYWLLLPKCCQRTKAVLLHQSSSSPPLPVSPLSGRLDPWSPARTHLRWWCTLAHRIACAQRCAPIHSPQGPGEAHEPAVQGPPCSIAPDYDRGPAAAARSTSLPEIPPPDAVYMSLSCHLLGRPVGWLCLNHPRPSLGLAP